MNHIILFVNASMPGMLDNTDKKVNRVINSLLYSVCPKLLTATFNKGTKKSKII